MSPPLLLLLSLFLSFIPSHAQLVLNGGGMGMGMGMRMGQPQPPSTLDITAPGAPGINTGSNTGINLNGLNAAGMGLNGLEGLNSLNSLNSLNGVNAMSGMNGLNSLNVLNSLGTLNGFNTLGEIPLTNAGLGGLVGNYGTLAIGGFNGLNTAGLGTNLANYGGLNGFGNNFANFGAINGLNTGGMNGVTTTGFGLGGANTLGGLQTIDVNPYGTIGYGGLQTMGTTAILPMQQQPMTTPTATIPMNTAPAATNYDPFATFGSSGNIPPATTYTLVTYPAANNHAIPAAPYTPPATSTTTYVQPATQAVVAPQTITLPTRVINLPAQAAATSPTSATSNTNDGYGTILSKLEVPDPSDTTTTTTRRSRPSGATTRAARPRQYSRSRGRPRARPRTRASTPASTTTEQNVNDITDAINPTSEQLSSIIHQLHTLQQVQIQQTRAQQVQAQQTQDQQTQLQQHLQLAQQRQQQIEALVQAQAAATAHAQSEVEVQAQTRAQVQAQEQAQAPESEPASVPSIRDQPQPHPKANPNCPAVSFTSKMLLVQPGTNANGGSIYKLIFTTTSPSSANWVDVHLMKNPSSDAFTISADSTPIWEVNMRMTPVPSSLLSTSRIDSILSERPPQQRQHQQHHLLAINDPSYTAFEVYLPIVPMKDDETLAYMLTYGTIKDEKEIACDSEIQIFTPSNTAPPTHLIQETSQLQPALQSTSHKTSQSTSLHVQSTSPQTSQVQPTLNHRLRAVTTDPTHTSQQLIHDEITSILGTSSMKTPACPSITYTPTFNLLVTPSTSSDDTERYYSIVFKGKSHGKKINWVDVHVGINTSSHSDSWAQSNFRLIATSPTTFEHTLPVPISNGDSITYQFTYSAGGIQCDSEVYTMSSTELLQAANVTAG